VQGIWPASQPNATINAVDVSKDQRLIATADDFGRVKLFNYPCTNALAGYIQKPGHSSHVTNCRFEAGAEYLVTTGGNERAVLQYKITPQIEG
jgi:microtubule-associated protein-like 6